MGRIELYLFGIRIGIRHFLLTGRFRVALKRILLPFNYWRGLMFEIVANYLLNLQERRKSPLRVLDIGSPKMLALFLASKADITVHATDLQDPLIFSEWQGIYESNPHKGRILFDYVDAKSIPFPDRYFDVIYSLSVIQVISPGHDGDIMALMEMQKKIISGGLLIIEVPYRPQYTVTYAQQNDHGKVYLGHPVFQRRLYDETAIRERIIDTISGKLLHRFCLFEYLPFDSFWERLPRYIKRGVAGLGPWMDMCNTFVVQQQCQRVKAKSIILIFEIN